MGAHPLRFAAAGLLLGMLGTMVLKARRQGGLLALRLRQRLPVNPMKRGSV